MPCAYARGSKPSVADLLRLGVLGAARISTKSVLTPALETGGSKWWPSQLATGDVDAVADMEVIDAAYLASGLPLRGT
ncbi:MAG: hypothetical protein ACI8TP_002714 [Acidimicrobiales bacterium]|jgi:hypothetical protein